MDISPLIDGFMSLLSPQMILICFLGAFVGTLGGVLPGLGITATMALTLPLVYTMDPLPALAFLGGITYGANFGNSTAAILLRIPGDPGALATAIDGYQLALRGKAGQALAVAAISSAVGAFIATLGVGLLSPLLVPIVTDFGQPEFFALLLLAMTLVSSLSPGSTVKAVLMAAFGIALTLPGLDPLTGGERYTLGLLALRDGLDLVVVAMGLFAFGEMFYVMRERRSGAMVPKIEKLLPPRKELTETVAPTARGTVLGFLVGILPGAGSTAAAFASYGLERKLSHKVVGHGSLRGVAGPEAANNAAAAGAFVPLLSLGIPGSAPLALVLGTLTVLGVRPGPLFLSEQPDIFWGLIAALLLSTLILLLLNLPLVGLWARVLTIPFPVLVTVVLVLTTTGVYAVRGQISDVLIAAILGAFGVALRLADFPLAPALLGFVLGGEIERSFRQSLAYSNGDLTVFVETPMRLALLVVAFLFLVGPGLRSIISRWRNRAHAGHDVLT